MNKSKDPNTFTNLAYSILKTTGKPMNYRDLTEKILKKKKIKGKTPAETLRVLLDRDDRFVKIDEGIWRLK